MKLPDGAELGNNALLYVFFVETVQEIDLHSIILIISTYPSKIWDKSSASYACKLVQNSRSKFMAKLNMYWKLIKES
jgi:hypothetical protein